MHLPFANGNCRLVVRTCLWIRQHSSPLPSTHPLSLQRKTEELYAMTLPLDNHTRMAYALNQIQNKKPLPKIDFTTHKLEDGNTINTQERVIKEVCLRIHLSHLVR